MFQGIRTYLAARAHHREARRVFFKKRRNNYHYWLNNGAASKIEDALGRYHGKGYGIGGASHMCIALKGIDDDRKYYGYDRLFVDQAITIIMSRIAYNLTLLSHLIDVTPLTPASKDPYAYRKNHLPPIANPQTEPKKFMHLHAIPFYRKLIKDIRNANRFS